MTSRDPHTDKEEPRVDDVVKSNFSGTLVSLSSERAGSGKDKVAYSDGVIAAFLVWRDSLPVRVVREGESSGAFAVLVRNAVAQPRGGLLDCLASR